MSVRFRLAPKNAAAPAAPAPAPAKPRKIRDVLKELFAAEAITDKARLDAWCGEPNRRKLYALLRERAPEHWEGLANPKAAARATYQSLLAGTESASDEEAAPASPKAVGGAEALPSTPPKASPSPEALALKLAEDLAEVHKREIARLTAVEAEYEALKAKMAATKLRQKEAHRAYVARKKAPSAAGGAGAAPAAAGAEPRVKDILDVFDFFPELVEELAAEDPGY
jgi:hypothetical protein